MIRSVDMSAIGQESKPRQCTSTIVDIALLLLRILSCPPRDSLVLQIVKVLCPPKVDVDGHQVCQNRDSQDQVKQQGLGRMNVHLGNDVAIKFVFTAEHHRVFKIVAMEVA
eukprot:NODE_14732_length_439_cov_46.357595_g14433_i0.p1 GENE.NODE_14732_length_439_cov_46.357595_g14433_i0~~NODE_14732_length_439_cov_46.357595_g14433_i0.p1  ORF type:complete len:130 (-),score=16.46 NODE_14732_length_439_cov_46.357595_g14433_i0:48-380(-)